MRRGAQIVTWSAEEIGKGGYDHYMYKEIPGAAVLAARRDARPAPGGGGGIPAGRPGQGGEAPARRGPDRHHRLRDSWHAGLIGAYMLEELARIPVTVEYASEFRYRNAVLSPGALVLGISQSGETADTLAALREARRRGCRTMGIVNVVGSSVAPKRTSAVYLHAGPEIGVASTKAFSSQIVALALSPSTWRGGAPCRSWRGARWSGRSRSCPARLKRR